MKILGIDTSTSCGSIGLIDDDRVVSDYLLNSSVTHSERLLGSVELILKEARCRLEDLDGWAISLGPGSFTGLRIGVSTAKGLAFATQKPVAGVPTLDALASQIAPTPYLICPILDARKEEIYTSFYRYDKRDVLKRISPHRAMRPEALVKEVVEKTIFVGDGVRTYGDFLHDALSVHAAFPPSSLHYLRGSTVAQRGLQLLQKGEGLDLSAFTPLYVRRSEAEIKWAEKYPVSST